MRIAVSRELYARRLYCVTTTGRAPSFRRRPARSASPWSGSGSAISPRRNERATSIETPNRSLSEVSSSSSLNSIHAAPGFITPWGRDREKAATRQRDAHAVLHVGGDGPVERSQEIFRDGAVLCGKDLGSAETDVRLDRGDVLEDAPPEEAHRMPGVVHVDAREGGRHAQQDLVVVDLEPDEQRDRRGEVPERIHAARKERARTRPDRCDDLAVHEPRGGAGAGRRPPAP